MDDEDDIFADTLSHSSITSNNRPHRPRISSGDYMSLSRNTIYHSADDIQLAMADFNTSIEMDSPIKKKNDKVGPGQEIVTYTQWKDRVTFMSM